MRRRDIDAFGRDQVAERPPFCRVLITASDDSQREMSYNVRISGAISDVETVLIHCTREQGQSEAQSEYIIIKRLFSVNNYTLLCSPVF